MDFEYIRLYSIIYLVPQIVFFAIARLIVRKWNAVLFLIQCFLPLGFYIGALFKDFIGNGESDKCECIHYIFIISFLMGFFILLKDIFIYKTNKNHFFVNIVFIIFEILIVATLFSLVPCFQS